MSLKTNQRIDFAFEAFGKLPRTLKVAVFILMEESDMNIVILAFTVIKLFKKF